MINFYTRVGDRILDVDPGFFQFSAGEWHFNPEPNHYVGNEIAYIDGPVDVNDYIKLLMWHDVVAEQDGNCTVFIPYLPAARADKGTPRGANIYSALLKKLWNAKVFTLDAHSEYMPKYLRTSGIEIKNIMPSEIIPEAFVSRYFQRFDGILAPDEGAVDRANSFAQMLGDIPVYVAKKNRDLSTGYINNYEAPELPEGNYLNLLVVDDICDGGATFEILSSSLKSDPRYSLNLTLFVTHGIFSKGLDGLCRRFSSIYTVNHMTADETKPDPLNFYPIDIKNELMKEYS